MALIGPLGFISALCVWNREEEKVGYSGVSIIDGLAGFRFD
ncbi:hypothetical protein ES703_27354 [subsurface metagenome]